MPAHQGFCADDQAAVDVDLGLIVDAQFPLFSGSAQASFQCDTLTGDNGELFGKIGKTAATFIFGSVECNVSIIQKRFRAVTVLWKQANADAGANSNLSA